MTSFWCLYYKLRTFFTPFSSVATVGFDQAKTIVIIIKFTLSFQWLLMISQMFSKPDPS